MLVEAVGLLMGGRASADLIRTGETQAQVQAEFDVADVADLKVGTTTVRDATALPTTVRSAGLQASDTLIVRRDINAQGRSRAFVNDTLVTAASLGEPIASAISSQLAPPKKRHRTS